MAEQIWDNFARINAGERFKRQSAEMGAAVTEAIVHQARIAPGMHVLDVACGSGEPSISIALALGGSGSVVGVDTAEEPLNVARGRADKRGLKNIHYLHADVHALPFANASFDRVTSRLGVMFFEDLPKALAEIHRVLNPGGSLVLLAWGAMEQPYFDLTVGTIRRLRPELEVPPGARKMFKFGVPGTLAAVLREAGFVNVHDEMHKLRWDWHGPPEELWDYFRNITVPWHPLLDKVAADREVDEAVLTALRESFDGEYVKLDAEMIIASGEKR